MSIIQTLKKLVDPEKAREEQLDREARQTEVSQPRAADTPPLYQCSVCGLEDARGTYCPDCLADTMEYIGPPGQDHQEQTSVMRPSCQGCNKSRGK